MTQILCDVILIIKMQTTQTEGKFALCISNLILSHK